MSRRLNRIFWILGLLSLSLFHSTHAFAQFTSGPADSWKWISGTVEDAVSVQNSPSLFGPPKATRGDMDPQSPIVQRMQRWIDLLHARLIQQDPNNAFIPKPIVRIYRDEKPNGIVYPLSSCVSGQFLLMPAPGNLVRTSTQDTMFFLDDSFHPLRPVELTGADKVIGRCTTPPPFQLQNFLQHISRVNTNCISLLASNGGYAFSAGCRSRGDSANSNFNSEIDFNQLAYRGTLNVISISSGVLTNAENESQALGVLLHEASHYYRAHNSSGVTPPLTFFYDHLNSSPVDVPTRSSALANLGAMVLIPEYVSDFFEIPGARFHSLTSWNMDFIADTFFDASMSHQLHFNDACAGDSACLSACQDFTQHARKLEPITRKHFAASPPSAADIGDYLETESKIYECFRRIPIVSSSPKAGSPIDMDFAQRRFGFGSEKAIYGIDHRVQNLADVLTIADLKNRAVIANELQAQRQHLGFYTIEQDADRIGTRWLWEFGGNPSEMPNYYLRLLHRTEMADKSDPEAIVPFGYINAEDCQRFHDSGWMDGQRPIEIPIGGFDNIHHSLCYRAHELDQLALKLGPTRLNSPSGLLGNEQWSNFVGQYEDTF